MKSRRLSVAHAMMILIWTLVLLMLMFYVVAVFFCQVVAEFRITQNEVADQVPGQLDADKCSPAKLESGPSMDQLRQEYYGSLALSMYSLFQSITGGIDWNELAAPLADMNWVWGLIFCGWIAFMVLAIMNVITGVFVECSMKSAQEDDEIYMVNNARDLFAKAHETGQAKSSKMMTWEEFESQLNTPEMAEYFKSIDVDLSEARQLFDLIDLDGSGEIDSGEFLSGVVRLHGPAKALDVAVLMHEIKDLSSWFQAHLHFMEDCLVHLSDDVPTALETLTNMKANDQKLLEKSAHKESMMRSQQDAQAARGPVSAAMMAPIEQAAASVTAPLLRATAGVFESVGTASLSVGLPGGNRVVSGSLPIGVLGGSQRSQSTIGEIDKGPEDDN
eukprot:gnl/TRDRNA2_/TRDRNA2_120717_c2_seq2.p1 gnl/TRDRNA2_/TRDRNA2_120717_c2~~gnl/TRDRNA2_/TRDRNA2_120717_c2_seq2.p1  ORF type:complete len:389 (-),score=80.16 gnl/TRDRNA2_/TRDRNA2_120717_c2_seq2:241-1407(-)